jgi:hypothetical protein
MTMTVPELKTIIDTAFLAVDQSLAGPMFSTQLDANGNKTFNVLAVNTYYNVLQRMMPQVSIVQQSGTVEVKQSPTDGDEWKHRGEE